MLSSAKLFRLGLMSAALVWLLAFAGARAETPVTFRGSVFMADGVIDPADVKIVLTNNEGDEVRRKEKGRRLLGVLMVTRT